MTSMRPARVWLCAAALAALAVACTADSERAPAPAAATVAPQPGRSPELTAIATVTPTPPEPTTTGPATPSPTNTPAQPTTATVTARVIAASIEVRLGPGDEYAVLGRLLIGNSVDVAAAYSEGGEWLAIPGVGWIKHDERIALDGAVSELGSYSSVYYEVAGPSHPPGLGTGIDSIDSVISLVLAHDVSGLVDLMEILTVTCPARIGIGEFPCPDGITGGSPIDVVATVDGCDGWYALAGDRRDVMLAWFSAGKAKAGQGGTALYAVFEAPDGRRGIVFSFENGVGGLVWVSENGSITVPPNTCEFWPPNELIRSRPGKTPPSLLLAPVRPEVLAPPATGIAAVDLAIAAVYARSAQALLDAVNFQSIACADDRAPHYDQPACAPGEQVGTAIDVILRTSCSGDWLRADQLDSLLRGIAEQPYVLVTVVRVPEEYFPPGEYALVFETPTGEFPGTFALLVAQGGVAALDLGCPDPAPAGSGLEVIYSRAP